MRTAAAAVVLLALVTCASQPGAPRSLLVNVLEQRGHARPTSVEGQHAFHVRITNKSDEAVSIDSISLASVTNLLQFHDGDQIVGETIEPAQTADFQIW